MSGERPRLNLKPRDPEAAKRADAERAEKLKASPFGAARPREQTLASRTGKTEEEILQEAIKHERLRLRLSAPQLEQKQQLEMLVEDAKEQLSLESDEGARENLKEVIKQREAAIDALLDKFSREALAAAQRGEIQRPSERRAMQQMDPITMLEMLAAGNPPGFPGGRGGGRGSGGGGYNPTRDHQMGGIGGRGGGRGRGGWGAGAPFEDSYLPGMPPPMMPLGADLDPDMIDYKSPFQPSQDRF